MDSIRRFIGEHFSGEKKKVFPLIAVLLFLAVCTMESLLALEAAKREAGLKN